MKSEAMFGYAAPEVWNLLLLSVRHGNPASQFKIINLKSHYCSLAFHNVHDL